MRTERVCRLCKDRGKGIQHQKKQQNYSPHNNLNKESRQAELPCKINRFRAVAELQLTWRKHGKFQSKMLSHLFNEHK